MADEGGVWRTISGRRVFIKDGQSLTDAMRESGKFGESKTRVYGRSDLLDAKKLCEEIIEENEYEYYGFRVQEEDTEKVGETIEHTSKNFGGDFEGAQEEGEDLDGVSSIRADIIKQVDGNGGYDGSVLYLIGANDGEFGYDPGEFIMKDSVVLAKMRYEDGSLKIVEKVNAGQGKSSVSAPKVGNDYAGTKTQVSEYISFKTAMEKKYGADGLWGKMSDSEYDKMERLERMAYRGK